MAGQGPVILENCDLKGQGMRLAPGPSTDEGHPTKRIQARLWGPRGIPGVADGAGRNPGASDLGLNGIGVSAVSGQPVSGSARFAGCACMDRTIQVGVRRSASLNGWITPVGLAGPQDAFLGAADPAAGQDWEIPARPYFTCPRANRGIR